MAAKNADDSDADDSDADLIMERAEDMIGIIRISVAITPDGRRILSNMRGMDKDSSLVRTTIKIWDLYTMKISGELKGHTERVQCLAVSPDGRHVVSGDGRGVV